LATERSALAVLLLYCLAPRCGSPRIRPCSRRSASPCS